MKSWLWLPLLLLVLVAIPVGSAEYSRWFVQRQEASTWSKLRDADLTTNDPANLASLTITALAIDRAPYVGCSLRVAAISDFATVEPIYYTSGGGIERCGVAQVCSATNLYDTSSQYITNTQEWPSYGSYYVKFRISSITGTVKEVWGGTR